MNIRSDLERMNDGYATKQELEIIDRDITYLLNKVCKKIEELRRGIPCSKEKVKRYAVLQIWKSKLKQLQGKYVSQNKIELRLQYIEIDTKQVSIEQTQDYIEEAKKKWEELIEEGQKFQEKEILKFHKNNIPEDTDENKKKRKEIIKRILKARRRNYSF